MPTPPKLVRATQLDATNVALEFDQDLSQSGFDASNVAVRISDGTWKRGTVIGDLSDEVLEITFDDSPDLGVIPRGGSVTLLDTTGLFGTDGGLQAFPFVNRSMVPRILAVDQTDVVDTFIVHWDRNANQGVLANIQINDGSGTNQDGSELNSGDGTNTWSLKTVGGGPGPAQAGRWMSQAGLATSDEGFDSADDTGRLTPP